MTNCDNISKKQYLSLNATEYTIFFLSDLSPTQTGWFESTPRIIVCVKNMMCSNLSHRHHLALRLIVIANANLIGN
jgi:hypothetical protein